MVKAEERNSVADGWEEAFEKNRLVPPSSQTVRQAEENHLIAACDGYPTSFVDLQDLTAEEDVTYQLRVTLFDRKLQHFFGKTGTIKLRIRGNRGCIGLFL
uniref:Uncharacterized protein n=1 Tax=Cyprinodon variegatus TaxID=28743 RepID=A0A3Q2CW71_CYPVA